MESKIEISLLESLSFAEDMFKNDSTLEQFEKTGKEFDELVKRGIAKKRGYNLLSISDKAYMRKVTFNGK